MRPHLTVNGIFANHKASSSIQPQAQDFSKKTRNKTTVNKEEEIMHDMTNSTCHK